MAAGHTPPAGLDTLKLANQSNLQALALPEQAINFANIARSMCNPWVQLGASDSVGVRASTADGGFGGCMAAGHTPLAGLDTLKPPSQPNLHALASLELAINSANITRST